MKRDVVSSQFKCVMNLRIITVLTIMGALFSLFFAKKETPSPTKQEALTEIEPAPVVVETIPHDVVSNISNIACFGAGCYWGTEKYFKIEFGKKRFPGSIVSGQVGFMGPKSSPSNPSYEDVCTGVTGHVEVYHFEFKGGEEMYENLVKFFFQFHDPTTLNKVSAIEISSHYHVFEHLLTARQ